MSLVRRLWLLVIATTLLAFGGSLAVTTLSFRDYLEQQLTVKNIDNASVLAMSLTHTSTDPVERELSIAAQFDSGHYELIRLTAPDGRVLVERQAEAADGVPPWLVRLVPLRPKPGVAQVSSGWQQVGTLTVASHTRYAYVSLWQGALKLALWFALGGVATGLAGVWLLGRVTRPLRDVVAQAEDIGRRRFVTIAEPAIPELRSVARAMNATVGQLREMFGQEAERIENLRRQANLDEVTGLPNRRHFLDRLGQILGAEDAPPAGQLILLRIADLAGLDRGLGRDATDELLRQTGSRITNVAPDGSFAGRTGGGEFALLLPGLEEGQHLAERLVAEVAGLIGSRAAAGHAVHAATCNYRHGLAVDEILARADETLADAQADTTAAWYRAPDAQAAGPRLCGPDWEHTIRNALTERRLRLADFPVTAPTGTLIHMECPVRMRIEDSGDWLPAARFVPMARRRQLTAELDLAVVELALEKLASGSPTGGNQSGARIAAACRLRTQALPAARKA